MTELPKVHVPPRFDEPDTTTELVRTEQELEADRVRIVNELLSIDTQLASPDRTDPATGKRMRSDDYWAWRHAAIAAKKYKTRELLDVKAQLVQTRDGIEKQPGRLERKVDLLLQHFGLEWVEP